MILVLFLKLVINNTTPFAQNSQSICHRILSTTICKCKDFIHKSNFRKYELWIGSDHVFAQQTLRI